MIQKPETISAIIVSRTLTLGCYIGLASWIVLLARGINDGDLSRVLWIYTPAVVLLFLVRYLPGSPYLLKSSVLLGILTLIALNELYTFGVSGFVFPFFMAVVLLGAIAYGYRKGTILFILSLCISAFFCILYQLELIPRSGSHLQINSYQLLPWLSILAPYAGLTAGLLAALGMYQRQSAQMYEEQEELIEQRNQEIQEALRSVRSREVFNAVQGTIIRLNHKLNTPLSNAMLAMETLEKRPDNPETQREALRILKAGLDSCRSIMQQNRDLSERLIPGTIGKKVPVQDAFEMLVQLSRENYPKLEVAVESPPLGTDFPQIPFVAFIEICQILMENTMIHNEGESELRFTVGAYKTPKPHIRFTDNGRGISEDARNQLFIPFQSSKGVNRMGMGLTIAKRIAMERFTDLEAVGEKAEFRLLL